MEIRFAKPETAESLLYMEIRFDTPLFFESVAYWRSDSEAPVFYQNRILAFRLRSFFNPADKIAHDVANAVSAVQICPPKALVLWWTP